MKGLKHKTDAAAPQQRDGVIVEGRQIGRPRAHTRPVSGLIETGEQIEQRRLADAGLAHDGKILAGLEFEIEPSKIAGRSFA